MLGEQGGRSEETLVETRKTRTAQVEGWAAFGWRLQPEQSDAVLGEIGALPARYPRSRTVATAPPPKVPPAPGSWSGPHTFGLQTLRIRLRERHESSPAAEATAHYCSAAASNLVLTSKILVSDL